MFLAKLLTNKVDCGRIWDLVAASKDAAQRAVCLKFYSIDRTKRALVIRLDRVLEKRQQVNLKIHPLPFDKIMRYRDDNVIILGMHGVPFGCVAFPT